VRRLAAGAAVGAYLLGVVVTGLSGQLTVRPLYDGFAPATPYRWVNPPAELRSANRLPLDGTKTLTAVEASDPISLNTHDSQANVTLAAGGLQVPGASSYTVSITPLDTFGLATLPGPDVPVGNVYRVQISAAPGGPVARMAKAGTVQVLQPVSGARALYFSADGRAWAKLEAPVVGQFLSTTFDRPGYFVAAGPRAFVPPPPTGPPDDSDQGFSRIRMAVAVLVLLILVGVIAITVSIRGGRRLDGAG
jgi:hypothetical protein